MNGWPYPRWIAHRGAGKLAPENTLAAFRLGAQHGYRMFECDAKLSADGVPFLMHDPTLQRTSSGHGLAGQHAWRELSLLDAGGWHSRAYAGEPVASLDSVLRFCLRNGFSLNVEIKPSPGQEHITGLEVARACARAWAGAAAAPVLLSSFSRDALEGAAQAEAALPRGLLLDTLSDGWLAQASALDCRAVICNHALWDSETVAAVHSASMRCLSYTVNDEWAAERLQALGTDGIITDRVDRFSPAG